MGGLVKANLPTTGKGERGKLSPALGSDPGHLHMLRPQILQSSIQVITHKVEFALVVRFRVMEGSFKRRHREDQPPVPSIHTRQFENISEEGSVSFWVFRIYNNVYAIDHELKTIV